MSGSYNAASSITDNGAGDFTITWERDFARASSYALMNLARVDTSVPQNGFVNISSAASPTAGTVRVIVTDQGGTASDPPVCCLIAWGQ